MYNSSTHPLSSSSLIMSLCEVSMALMSGVPPFTDWASMLPPASSRSLTTFSCILLAFLTRTIHKCADPFKGTFTYWYSHDELVFSGICVYSLTCSES